MPIKSNCKYKNARFHYADIRDRIKSMRNVYILIGWIVNQQDKYNEHIKDYALNYSNAIIKMFETELFINGKIDIEHLFEKFKIKKQLDNCPKNISSMIKNFTYNQLRSIDFENIIKTYYNLLKKIIETKSLAFTSRRVFDKSLNDFAAVFTPFMDAFTLGRMFRTYNGKEEAKNIIIYQGDVHSTNIRKFLSLIGFETIIQRRAMSQCLPTVGFGSFFKE